MPATTIFGLRRGRLSYDFTGTRATKLGAGLTHADLSGAKLSADGCGFGDALPDLSADADLLTAMSHDLLSALPQELQLLIAEALGDRCDRAALALASPRLLGLAACRELPSYQGLEMSLAFHRVLGGAIDEQLLRSYASRSEATPEGCEWLAGVDAAAGVLVVSGNSRESVQTGILWRFTSRATRFGALLRCEQPSGMVHHYEGKAGAEYVVRLDEPDGCVWHFEGKKLGRERIVRCDDPDGSVWLCNRKGKIRRGGM